MSSTVPGVTDIEENEDGDELWPELVNFYGPTVLANLAKDMGLKLVSFSCQQVFDGHAREPYDEGDTVAPLNTYGKYKAEAEKVVLSYCPTALIVRTSLLFVGAGSSRLRCSLPARARWTRR
ncbi:MAG: sugar nucleotide-binding protein [Planctomycetota bacterium]|nr:sugar nucleotide-binding protein [Planctomycetota bacterium]